MESTRTTHVRQFKACQLAWRFTAVEKVPQAAKDNFETGTLVHREMEVWWLHGLEPQRPIAKATAKALEALLGRIGVARGDGRAEWNFCVDVDGIAYRGQSDLVLQLPDGTVWVIDYKTSADIDRYGLTEWQLQHDVQLGVYARQVLRELAPDAPGAHVAHVQIATGDGVLRHTDPGFVPRVDIVTAYMTRAQCETIWQDTCRTVADMARVARLPLNSVEGNLGHCGAYGGCQYRTRCPAYAKSKREEKPMYIPTLLDPKPTAPVYYPSAQPAPSTPKELPPLWLLVDVVPEIGAGLPEPVRHIDQVLRPLQEQVAAEARVPLYSMVEFGQGPARVVALLAKVDLSGTLLVDSMTPCANAVIEYLRQRAKLVLRRSR